MLIALVMVPTYNESENIASLVKDILELNPSYGVVVVDDDSPDGTSTIVAEMQKNEHRVHLITRKSSKGRGTAGIEGLLYAVRQDVPYIVEMDADYSHHPRHIPDLIVAMEICDVAIGSRSIEGGRTAGRGFLRQTITRFANGFIRLIMGVPVSDCTAGFRCFKRKVLQSINLENMVSSGPSIVEEILYACHIRGFQIMEVPILFEDRVKGKSTKTFFQYAETMLRIIQFRLTMKR